MNTSESEPTLAPLSAHQLSMTVLMSPDMANFSGNVHGGAILKLLDQDGDGDVDLSDLLRMGGSLLGGRR